MKENFEITDERIKEFASLQQQIGEQRLQLKKQSRELQENLARSAALKASINKEATSTRNQDIIKSQTEELQKTNATISELKKNIGDISGRLHDYIDAIIVELDPRKQAELMDDHNPFLLLPVRVETRFMVVKHIARLHRKRLPFRDEIYMNRGIKYSVKEIYPQYNLIPVIEDVNELWIRIFPDDIAIQKHEEELTEAEMKAAQIFWTQMWYAGKNVALENGAWRGVVGGRTPERAAWICNQLRPTNPADAPGAPVDPDQPLPKDPQFPTPPSKPSSWSQMPHSKVMPDRFVVRLYSGNTYREVVGKRVPDPLPVSLDPQDAAASLDNKDGKLVLPEKLRWIQDFDEAEKIGMAIRVPLSQAEKTKGFTKLLVLGLKASANTAETKNLLEELVENHHYAPGGFSLVQQGTPTNNTDDAASGYTAHNEDDDDLFDIEIRKEQFTQVASDDEKSDGQRLADALGIDYDKLYHVRNAGLKDIKEGMCMNHALWPTTLGYYLSQIMYPVFTDAEIKKTKDHFCRYVLGRGRIPAIRVDDQPYGILPVTAFSKWTYQSTSSNEIFMGNMLWNVLQKMEATWDQLATQVKHADQTFTAATTDKAFLEILGLHPSSVEFYQRFATGPYFLWNMYAYNNIIQNLIVDNYVTYADIFDFGTLFKNLDFLLSSPPRVFDFAYAAKEKYLSGPVIDPYPFSEKRTLNVIGSKDENYIDWLYMSDYHTISKEDFSNIGAPGALPPRALLYLMLRHSCMLEYVHTGINILVDKSILSADVWLDRELMNIDMKRAVPLELENLIKKKIEFTEGAELSKQLLSEVDTVFAKRAEEGLLSGVSFKELQVQKMRYLDELKMAAAPDYEKRVSSLLESEVKSIVYTGSKVGAITSKYDFIGDAIDLSDYIRVNIKGPIVSKEFQEMAELQAALKCLRGLSTASLERLFAEHIDLVSYRLDAWFYSLASQRLDKLRNAGGTRKTDTYLGAYSWLENVKPGNFPGIAYREVEIEPDRFVIPGIDDVLIREFELPVKITPGPIKTQFDYLMKTEVQPVMNNLNLRNTMLMESSMSFASGELEMEMPLIKTGGLKMVLNATRQDVMVDFPDLIEMPKDLGPAYIYLGSSEVGPITYDTITNKFISKPRVDPTNQGYIHAPSINQASTAALLRAGYESHKLNPGSTDNVFAVNLSSERVRTASGFLEGIRNGQELAALLGYQFERGLHDLDLNLDQYIRDIRLKYPFVAARVTNSSGATDINEAEAYNVVDGLKLMEAYRDNPLHWADGVTFSPLSDKNLIAQQIDKMMDSMDAVHDLLLAESVHQVVQGNSARSSAAFNAIAGNSAPPDPQVIKTPRQFNAITHRLGIVFDNSAGGHKIWTADGTPRSLAEPRLNRWLASQLPAADKIVVNCSYTDINSGQTTDITMSADELKLEPIDFLYLMDISLEDDKESDLYALISYYIRLDVAQLDNINIVIKNSDRTGLSAAEITLHELKPLTDTLFKIVRDGKILDAKDFIPGTQVDDTAEANAAAGLKTAGLLLRLQDAAGVTMANGQKGLSGLVVELTAAINDLAPNLPPLPSSFNPNQYARLRAAMLHATYFGVAHSTPATATGFDLNPAKQMVLRAKETLEQLKQRKATADQQLGLVAGQTTEKLKLAVLLKAAEAIFGRSFRLYPDFTFYLPAAITAAKNYTGYLDYAGPLAVHEWLQGLAPVRQRVRSLQQLNLLSEALLGHENNDKLSVIQFPLAPVDGGGNIQARWVGMQLPNGYELPQDNLSLVFAYPQGFNVNATQCGMIIDEWVEEIPVSQAQTGIAVHYNNPNSETPNVCLLAVSPNINGAWSWDDLMDTLNETLHWAKKRAVDPDLLNQTAYAQVLPATMAALSGSKGTPTLDYGRNNVPKPKRGYFDLVRLQDYTQISRSWMKN